MRCVCFLTNFFCKGGIKTRQIYVDNAATTKMRGAAVEAMTTVLRESYGNPSSLHSAGLTASRVLEQSRREIAECLGAKPEEIFFTSGGSEADNQAILTGAEIGAVNGKRHIISQKTEHHAVLNTLKRLEKLGYEIELLDVDENGWVSAEQVDNAIREDTALVTIMMANNEIGTIMPVEKIAEVCREKGVLFHTDAVQAVGHILIDVKDIDCDMLSLSAHKFGGAKGVGALYVRGGVTPSTLISGGGQERGVRGGTENVAGVCAMAAALKESLADMERDNSRIIKMRDKLIKELSYIPYVVFNGSAEHRLPGVVNVCFEGIEGESLLLMLDARGICASAGSACNSGSLMPSHVLTAIGRSDELARGTLRISLSADNTMEEVEFIANSIKECVKFLRSVSPVWDK